MQLITSIKESLIHLAFPHICEGCGSDVVGRDHFLCAQCLSALPATQFHMHAGNPIEKIFWGRLPVSHATAQYYFTKKSLVQHLLHSVKYRRNKELCLYFGRMMGQELAASNRFRFIDALVPLPLSASRLKKRGFNQSAILCDGIAAVLQIPVLKDVVSRKLHTESQTSKSRLERWQNMEGKFEVLNNKIIEGRHLLLVDDVITTGATLEGCGQALMQSANIKLSIAALCFSSH